MRLRDTSLGWDNSELVRNLSFDVPAGTWTCLLGESGVGKSTLLRTIAGLIEPRATTQVLADDGAPVAGRVAFMAQQDLLLPWLSAADNVALGARLRGERTDAARVRDLLERTGIAARGDARPGKLSGGERQRVALARTLMEDRPIVLMDEPFSALDAITRVELQALAFELLAGRTVVMVTHDPFEALRLATGVHVLSPGDNGSHIAMVPPGNPLRDPTDPSLRDSYRQIMEALGKRGMTGSPASAAA
ncbi:MAG: ABC transporter ATP-binding protein [Alphaproteobacteria bacterium]|nr:ABC transporter ATP-binding protein [Alphaproteobacteria bacterium]